MEPSLPRVLEQGVKKKSEKHHDSQRTGCHLSTFQNRKKAMLLTETLSMEQNQGSCTKMGFQNKQ